jgi:hypothetical protein
MAGIMKKEGVVRFRILDEPTHGIDHILPIRNLSGVFAIVREQNDVIRTEAAVAN